MHDRDASFVIPTYRLRDVGETVEQYDEHLWRNGHAVPILVFDDSSASNQEKYYPLLEQTHTHNELYYIGPSEKEQFLAYLGQRLQDKRLQLLVKNLFRSSYGGNRNYTLMYTPRSPSRAPVCPRRSTSCASTISSCAERPSTCGSSVTTTMSA